ncbi:hypothetical protein ACFFQW_47150 [Umezawaea endophytica]|uniref:DNA-binding transcriptional regulator of glucitol operon n=1 Tax=Umezawaea endophytica TaxID=1654476 RepID=A0A9X3AF41_9PSEU|nr:hypothetical protein [Umezawaea endophytica]MCS7478217.1 hypothetical protein [Umezawaea endophytica]
MSGGPITSQRVAIALVCVVALVGCCGLAWWQWTRFESASGTFQNLGYVLQWPLFGLFPAFMVWRIRKLDAQRKAEPPVVAPTPVVTVDAVRAPAVDEDDELAVYNRYLAELNSRDQR